MNDDREEILKLTGPFCICECPCCDVDFDVSMIDQFTHQHEISGHKCAERHPNVIMIMALEMNKAVKSNDHGFEELGIEDNIVLSHNKDNTAPFRIEDKLVLFHLDHLIF